MNNKEFYNKLADFYDSMIDFESAIARRSKLLKPFTKDKNSALDIGCGTGIDSISLAKSGLKVEAVDQSSGMIKRAKNNAQQFNAEINFTVSDLADLNFEPENFDLVLSLGNSLANVSKDKLKEAVTKIKKYLKSGGSVLIQILNYNLLPASGIFPVNKKENDILFINRYYEISNEIIKFNIDYTDKLEEESESIQTGIFPHSVKTFQSIFTNFKLELFGSLNRAEYNSENSKDLVIFATKL